VVATFTSGEVTVGDLRGRWWVDRIEADTTERLLPLLVASAEREDSDSLWSELESQARDAALDHIIAAHAVAEGWGDDWAILHGARRLVVERSEREAFLALASDIADPPYEILAPMMRELAAAAAKPERRAARVLTIPTGEAGPTDAQRAQAEDALQRLRDGEEFATLVAEFGEGPGFSAGGELASLAREEAPWPGLGEAIFSAPEDGEPVLAETGIGLSIISITEVIPAHEPASDELRREALSSWHREERDRRRSRQISEWRREAGVVIISDAHGDEPLFTVDGEQVSAAMFESLLPALRSGARDQAIDRAVHAEMLLPRLHALLPEGAAENRWRAARALTLRSEWERRLTVGIAISPEEIRRVYDELVEAGSFPRTTQRHVVLCRVGPHRPQDPETPESLRLWRGLDEEVARVRTELAGVAASTEAFHDRVKALNAESPFAIEFLDMGLMARPPRFLGVEFFEMQSGSLSEPATPVENTRLIYAVTEVIPRRVPTFEEAGGIAESTAIARRREPVLRAARTALLDSADLHLHLEQQQP
jgi:hypothetical protein